MALPVPDDERSRICAEALAELESGKGLREIAAQHGLVHSTLIKWLLSAVPEQYRSVQRAGLLQRIVEADESLYGAKSHVEVARADRVCKYVRWDAERRLPDLFAQRHEISGPGGGPIELAHLERARRFDFLQRQVGAVIDVEAVSSTVTTAEPVDSATIPPVQPVPSSGAPFSYAAPIPSKRKKRSGS